MVGNRLYVGLAPKIKRKSGEAATTFLRASTYLRLRSFVYFFGYIFFRFALVSCGDSTRSYIYECKGKFGGEIFVCVTQDEEKRR